MAGVTSTHERARATGRRVALGPVARRWPHAADPVLLLVVALGAFLRFYRIGGQSLWADEYFTTQVLGSGRHMFTFIAHVEGTPPLYFLVLKGWEKVIGGGDGALRSLSAVAGTLTVPVAYAAARQLGGSRRVARTAAALVAVNPMLVWFSQEARAYSLLVLLASVSLLLCIRAAQSGQRRHLVLWGIASAAALSTHYFALFVLVGEALWLAVALRGRWRTLAWGVLPLAIVAPFLYAFFFRVQRKADLQRWVSDTPMRMRSAEVGRQALIGPGGWDDRLWIVAAAVVLLGAALVVARADDAGRRAAFLMIVVGGTGVVLPFIAAGLGNDFVLPRNLIASLVPLAIAIGIGLGARRAGLAGLVGTLVICLLSTAIVLAVANDPAKHRANWRAVAERLDVGSGQRVVVIDHDAHLAEPMLRYFHHARILGAHEVARVHEIDLVYHVSPPGGRCALFQGRSCERALYLFPSFPTSLANRFQYSGKPKIDDFMVNLYRSSRAVPVSAQDFRHRSQKLLRLFLVS